MERLKLVRRSMHILNFLRITLSSSYLNLMECSQKPVLRPKSQQINPKNSNCHQTVLLSLYENRIWEPSCGICLILVPNRYRDNWLIVWHFKFSFRNWKVRLITLKSLHQSLYKLRAIIIKEKSLKLEKLHSLRQSRWYYDMSHEYWRASLL